MLQRTGAIWQLNSLRIRGCRLSGPGALARNFYFIFLEQKVKLTTLKKKRGLLEIDWLRVRLIKLQRNPIEFIWRLKHLKGSHHCFRWLGNKNKLNENNNNKKYERKQGNQGNAFRLNLGDLCLPVKSLELVYVWTGGKLKMAAWRMEPFIQLTYAEKCPKQSLQATKTSFIDERSVTKCFWLYLLEQKCPGGLYFCLCRVSLRFTLYLGLPWPVLKRFILVPSFLHLMDHRSCKITVVNWQPCLKCKCQNVLSPTGFNS